MLHQEGNKATHIICCADRANGEIANANVGSHSDTHVETIQALPWLYTITHAAAADGYAHPLLPLFIMLPPPVLLPMQ